MFSNEKMAKEVGFDFDWYFLDSKGKIGIVASAGGFLPNSISQDYDRLNLVTSYFRSLPKISDEIFIEDFVYTEIKKYNHSRKEAALKDLKFMTSKGLYYFDKEVLNNYEDYNYLLKAKPKFR